MIGATIKALLAAESTLTALVSTRIFPYVMNEDTDLPAVVYSIDSLEAVYTKGGWVNDEISFSVASFSRSYTELQTVVTAVRTALELEHTGSGTQAINHIYLTGLEEGHSIEGDFFYNILTFKVTINTY